MKFERFELFLALKALPSLSSTGFLAEIDKLSSHLSPGQGCLLAWHPESETHLT